MRKALILLGWVAAFASLGFSQDGVLELQGIGAEGKEKYKGGKIEFLDVSIADQVVHLGDPKNIPLRLSIRYRVLEAAPVLLNSRLGTEHWRLCHYKNDERFRLYTSEAIDMSKPGEATVTVDKASVHSRSGAVLSKGLVGVRGHYYFLVDQPDGTWLDVVRPPAFFDRSDLVRKLTFTLANVSSFTLDLSEVQSTWTPGGVFRVKLVVRDADGETFPVVNAKTMADAGPWNAAMQTEMDYLNRPTRWMMVNLPDAAVPDHVAVSASISVMKPDGPEVRKATKTFAKGEGRKTEAGMRAEAGLPELPRTADGVVRETRALWLNPTSFMTKEGVENVVDRTHAAGLNMIVADIFVRSLFMGKSAIYPITTKVDEEGFDPLTCLIAKAHEKGIEVHPWFCVTYRDPKFRKWLPGVDVIAKDGRAAKLPADVHRPEYRDFIVKLMVGVARDYDVDGIHLDYIRAMENCYCNKCKAEFRQSFGKELTEASEEEWVRWQREAIGDIVRRAAEGVRAVRPKAKMSAAVFSNLAGGAAQGQDPAGWARKGWLDIVIPMDYKMDTLAVQSTEKQFLDVLDNDDLLVTGLSLYARSGGSAFARPADLVKQQIRLVRSLGIHGYCLFEFRYLSDGIIKMLREETNTEKAVPHFR